MKSEQSIKNSNNMPLDIPGEEDEIVLSKLIKARSLTEELFNLSMTLDAFEADNSRAKALKKMEEAKKAASNATILWDMKNMARYRNIYLAWMEFYNSIPE